jgi:hypothetical protein
MSGQQLAVKIEIVMKLYYIKVCGFSNSQKPHR